MAAGIEHRSIEGVMAAYDHFGKANYAVFQGRDLRDSYCEGNQEQGSDMLQSWLDMIQAGGTGTVYTLKVYPDKINYIDSKTPHSNSTTFMLNAAIPVKTENGVTIIDRAATANNAAANNGLMLLLKEMKESNEKTLAALQAEREAKHESEVSKLIGYVKQKEMEPPTKDVWDKIGTLIERKPDIIDRLFDSLDRFLTPNKTHEPQHHHGHHRQQYATPLNGTNNMSNEVEQQASAGDTVQRDEAMDDRQYAALDIIESKVGQAAITIALEKIANMPAGVIAQILNQIP